MTRPISSSVLILLAAIGNVRAFAPPKVTGRVIDQAGKPVADASVGCFWRANGPATDSDGKPFDLTRPENVQLFWGNLGRMEPMGRPLPIRSGADGRFAINDTEPYFAVMAIDEARKNGGIGIIPTGDEEVEIRLMSLVTVRGSFEGPVQRPHWTHVYIHLPEHPTRPLDSTRLVSCGSFEAKFEVRLPPGKYTLQAYSQPADSEYLEGELVPNKPFVAEAGMTDMDLGRLRLAPHKPDRQIYEAKAKAEGTWYDYTKHYGEQAPQWHADDARGVKKDVTLADYRGKWLLLEFWGMSCRPCLTSGMPNIMKFYEEHAAQRDRFEVLSICIDFDGELKSMADVDEALIPVIKHVWGGKSLPFPVLLDTTFKTWERFGIPGLGTVILVDPKGKLVEGDERVLAKKLEGLAKPK